MKLYTLQERIEIIKIHYENGKNLAETVRKTRTFLGRRKAPCRIAIKKLVEKFELVGQVNDVKNKTRARFLHKDLGLKDYKVQLTQEPEPADYYQ